MLDWLTSLDAREAILYIILFASGVLAVQGGQGLFQMATTRQTINRRLQVKAEKGSVEDLIIELRRQRGLNSEGDNTLFSAWANRLVTRSGLKFEPVQWSLMALGVAFAATVIFAWFTRIWIAAPIIFFVTLFGLPIFALSFIGARRAKKLAEQLPDAVAIIVRSLEAGHPVPTAISLVGQEMPDPIGTEFGMVSDEMAYGSGLSDSVLRLAQRSEDPDLDLFAATVRLQERTGGNLAELLKLIADAVRDRQTLRLKIKAASSEGRASAVILTAAPFVVGFFIHLLRPEFYGEVIHYTMVQIILGGFLLWMVIGNVIMQRMIRFKV